MKLCSMTDKEFKRLSRAQLIEVIYQLQLQLDELTNQNQYLENALSDKRLRVDNAGNIAKAALEINNCFRSAQDAAEQYLNEIKEIRRETEIERQKIISKAQEEASVIIANAKKDREDSNSVVATDFYECDRDHSDNG